MPFGPNGSHVPIYLIDFGTPLNNSYILTNQYMVRARETKEPDIALLINGLPVVIGEAKTPVRPSVSWLDGAHEVHEVYENAVPALFVPNILSFATDGKQFFTGPYVPRWNSGAPGGSKKTVMSCRAWRGCMMWASNLSAC